MTPGPASNDNADASNDNAALSDADIALMAGIGGYAADQAGAEARVRVAQLMAQGYVACSHPDMAAAGATFRLTRQGEAFLAGRG